MVGWGVVDLVQNYTDLGHNGLRAKSGPDHLRVQIETAPLGHDGASRGPTQAEADAGVTLIRNVADAFSLAAVAVTRGPRGALLRVLDEEVEHPGFAAVADLAADRAGARAATAGTENGDTVGAGDAFDAALCVGLLRGDSPGLIVENANRLAAYVCSQPGAMPPIPDDLKERLLPTT